VDLLTKATREIQKLVPRIEALAKESAAAREARALCDQAIESLVVAKMQDARCDRAQAIEAVAREQRELYAVYSTLVAGGIVAKAESEPESAPKPSKHETASRLVLQHAGELIRAGEYKDLQSALKDKRMRPYLDRWMETSGT
jgi:hypothetical protein